MGRGLKIILMEYVNNNNILHYSVEQEFWKKIESGKAKEVRLPLSNAWLSAFCGSPWCRRGDCGNCSASAQWACTDNNNVKYICFHCVGKSETITLKIEKISISYEMVGYGTISKCFIVSFSERTGALVELTVQEQRWNTFTRYIIFSRRGSVIFEKHNNILPWGGYTYIYGLWVVEEYRKTGIAGQLLDKAEEIACSLGCENVCLEWENTTPKWVFDWYIKKGYEELELSCSGSLLIKRFDIPQEQMKKNETPYVDLGLPSGTLWATCNVGATSPEQKGLYFAWGETEGYDDYQIIYRERSFDTDKYKAKDILEGLTLEQDIVHILMGGKWRMPTKGEYQELIDNCDASWTENYNGTGVAGYIFTSGVNGNSVFFPAAGYCGHLDMFDEELGGHYWSSTLGSSEVAWILHFDSNNVIMECKYRHCGLPVRGVCKR